MLNSANRMYFASSSDTRPPYFAKKRGVRHGSTTNAPMLTTTNTSVRIVKGEKIRPSAITVPRSLMKQAVRIALPNSVRFEAELQHDRVHDAPLKAVAECAVRRICRCER